VHEVKKKSDTQKVCLMTDPSIMQMIQ